MATDSAGAKAGQSAPLGHLAALCHDLRSTRSRLQKAALTAQALALLSDRDLQLACRFITARPFAAYDPRVLRLGPAAVLAALEAAGSTLRGEALRRRLVALGDLSSLATDVLPGRSATLTLSDCHAAFVDLATPTLKPAERRARLAALLARADAREAGLLVGIAVGELRIGFSTDALLDALARAHGHALPAITRVYMLVGDAGETAVRARQNELDAPLRLYHSLGCMLATPFDVRGARPLDLPSPFVAQDKFDGIRLQVHVGPIGEGDVERPGVRVATPAGPRRIALFSRTHDDVTQTFPDLWAPLLHAFAPGPDGRGHGIVDGELLAMHEGRPLPFTSLQARLGRKAPSAALQQQLPVYFIAFDVLAYGGALCIDAPWTTRTEQLSAWHAPHANVLLANSLSLHAAAQLDAAFAAARERGHEGLVLKHPGAAYSPGKRGRQWLKVKLPQATFDVVVVSCEVGFGRKRQWLSDLTFAVRLSESDATLATIGKAYSGLTDADLAELTPWFEAHTRQVLAHGKVRLVEPNVVLEVACDRVQTSKRHKSGYALRFARIVRVRRDKTVDDIDTLGTVAQAATALDPH